MHTATSQTAQPASEPSPAAKYRTAHQHRLMLLTKLKSEFPTRNEFCRIKAVETVAPNLWVTVGFLDGSTKGLRPEQIRLVTDAEELFAKELLNSENA